MANSLHSSGVRPPIDIVGLGAEPVDNYHDLSMEYRLALLDMQRLQPEFIAAQERYSRARLALETFISVNDQQLNLL